MNEKLNQKYIMQQQQQQNVIEKYMNVLIFEFELKFVIILFSFYFIGERLLAGTIQFDEAFNEN